MIDFCSNLLGDLVQYSQSDSRIWELGFVRAIGYGDKAIVFVVEGLEGGYGELSYGSLRTLNLSYYRIRPVRQCMKCGAFDAVATMARYGAIEDLIAGIGWEHREARGCKKP